MKHYKVEFETVEQILASNATTRRTDAFILTWVKMEKQLRRLFTFLAFQNPSFKYDDIDEFINVIVKNNHLYFYSFQKLINKLLNIDLGEEINGNLKALTNIDYSTFNEEIQRIKSHRNKIMHGQITGKKLSPKQLEKDIELLRNWIIAVGNYFTSKCGYDGLGRNTFNMSKSIPRVVSNYEFNNLPELEGWINKNA